MFAQILTRWMLLVALVALLPNCCVAADGEFDLAGDWNGTLECPGGLISFGIHFKRDDRTWRAELKNGPEKIDVPAADLKGNRLELQFPHYDSTLVAELQNGPVGRWFKGTFRKRRGEKDWVEMPFEASRPLTNYSRDPVQIQSDAPKFSGRWRVQFSESSDPAVGVFHTEKANAAWGTFLTTTGDYRFLTGEVSKTGGVKPKMTLSVFDGAHAFLFAAKAQKDGSLKGDFWSGTSWHETWTATKDANIRLPDAFELSRVLKDVDLNGLKFKDLNGDETTLGDKRFAGKARVIEVFGSWCPNCHDAARFLTELHDKYGPQGLSVVGVAFEHTTDHKRNARQVVRFQERHNAKYPCLLGGQSNKKTATEQFRLLDKIRSYPTTIFLHADGRVRAVYTGFSGPATGRAHEKLREQFDKIIRELLAEA